MQRRQEVIIVKAPHNALKESVSHLEEEYLKPAYVVYTWSMR